MPENNINTDCPPFLKVGSFFVAGRAVSGYNGKEILSLEAASSSQGMKIPGFRTGGEA